MCLSRLFGVPIHVLWHYITEHLCSPVVNLCLLNQLQNGTREDDEMRPNYTNTHTPIYTFTLS